MELGQRQIGLSNYPCGLGYEKFDCIEMHRSDGEMRLVKVLL